MIRVSNIKYPIDADAAHLRETVAKKYGIREITSFRIVRQSVDARKKSDIHYVYTVDVTAANERQAVSKYKNVSFVTVKRYRPPRSARSDKPVVIVGFGPAGMMCAHTLALCGMKVTVLERGNDVDTRMGDVRRLHVEGKLNPESNVQFGEGGAGTFSDGKLTTGVNDSRIGYVLEQFAAHGAPREILYRAKPHIGTDRLVEMVKAFRKDIIGHGGEIYFGTRLEEIVTRGGKVCAVTAVCGAGKLEIETDRIVLATGHSARDTFAMLQRLGVPMERKIFAIGARIEHSQEMISRAQYGDKYVLLPAADYKLAVKTQRGRTVYTFCMCPGGRVIASASEAGGVVTNGMSMFARDGENANSALLVNVFPSDLPGTDALSGCRFQREIERKAYEMCGGYFAPAQTVGDFLKGNGAKPELNPTYRPGVKYCRIDDVLPGFVSTAMREAIPLMDKKLSGFACDGAVLTAPETRSSSPVRVLRDPDTLQSQLCGLYPCGEGAGYAGGIMTAAVDGIKVAEAIAEECG